MANPYDFGSAFIDAVHFQRKMNLEQDQFKQKMDMENQQQSLLNLFKQKDDERQQQQLDWQMKYQQGLLDAKPEPDTSPKDIKIFEENGQKIYKGYNPTSKQWEKIPGNAYEKPNITNINMGITEAIKKNEFQGNYNDIMASPFVKKADLIQQGLFVGKSVDKSGKEILNPQAKYDGAYVVDIGNGKSKLIFDDKQLESYAKSKVPKTPNKWSRDQQNNSSNTQPKDKTPKYVEGKIYKDANGNQAKYVNGKWVEVK